MGREQFGSRPLGEIMDRVVTVNDSSQIKQISYNPMDRLMLVKFANGESYIYKEVSPTTFGAFVSWDSVGTYFNRNIKPNYEFEKVHNG